MFLEETRIREFVRSWLTYGHHNNDEATVDRVVRWTVASRDLSARVASVLGSDTIPVGFTHDHGTAWTDGDSVFISMNWFLNTIATPLVEDDRDALKLAWATMKAVVYHELSHIIWTPRKNQKPTSGIRNADREIDLKYADRYRDGYTIGNRWIDPRTDDDIHAARPNVWQTFNMIEDGRIENLFAARYTPAIPLFQAMIAKVFLSKQEDARNFMLFWGRKYLPLELRQASKAMFADEFDHTLSHYGLPTSDGIADMIDEFLTFSFPRDGDRAVEICMILAEVMWVVNNKTGQAMSGMTVDTHDEASTEGRPVSPAEQREDASRAANKFDDADSTDADDATDADAADDGGDGDGDADGDAEGDANDADSDSGSGGASCGTGKAMDNMLDQVQSSLDREFRSLQHAAGDADTSTMPKDTDTPVAHHRMMGDFAWPFTARRQLSDEISNVFSDTEAGWMTGMATGRLNIQSVMDARASEQFRADVFDQWQEDVEEATSFHVVVLLDRSGSMSTNVGTGQYETVNGDYTRQRYESVGKLAAGAAWALTRALEDNDIPVTLIGYDTVSTVLKTADTEMPDMVVPQWHSSGGTNPSNALEWARDVFAASEKQNLILVNITDGMFDVNASTMAELNAMADTLLVHLDLEARSTLQGTWWDEQDADRGHKDSVIFTHPDDMKQFASMVGRKVIDIANAAKLSMVA